MVSTLISILLNILIAGSPTTSSDSNNQPSSSEQSEMMQTMGGTSTWGNAGITDEPSN